LGSFVILNTYWKKMTNTQIRAASTLSTVKPKSASDRDLFFGSSKAPVDIPHPWLLVELEDEGRVYLFAFSRNSVEDCDYEREDQDQLGPPHIWLNHRHDWHDCKVLDECGKVNFHLSKRSDWETFCRVASVRAFKSVNTSPFCSEDDKKSLESVFRSSNLLRRIKSKMQAPPPPAFIDSLKVSK
jgi:hypothetical protein